jgi:cytidine deaminase
MKADYISDNTTIKQADLFRVFSYSPYSGFSVAAAIVATLKDTDKKIVVYGTNVENASYGLTICAERAALVELVQYKPKSIDLIIVAVGTDTPAAPCGACRQFISEFTNDCPVWLVSAGEVKEYTNIKTLLPNSFGPGNLKI